MQSPLLGPHAPAINNHPGQDAGTNGDQCI